MSSSVFDKILSELDKIKPDGCYKCFSSDEIKGILEKIRGERGSFQGLRKKDLALLVSAKLDALLKSRFADRLNESKCAEKAQSRHETQNGQAKVPGDLVIGSVQSEAAMISNRCVEVEECKIEQNCYNHTCPVASDQHSPIFQGHQKVSNGGKASLSSPETATSDKNNNIVQKSPKKYAQEAEIVNQNRVLPQRESPTLNRSNYMSTDAEISSSGAISMPSSVFLLPPSNTQSTLPPSNYLSGRVLIKDIILYIQEKCKRLETNYWEITAVLRWIFVQQPSGFDSFGSVENLVAVIEAQLVENRVFHKQITDLSNITAGNSISNGSFYVPTSACQQVPLDVAIANSSLSTNESFLANCKFVNQTKEKSKPKESEVSPQIQSMSKIPNIPEDKEHFELRNASQRSSIASFQTVSESKRSSEVDEPLSHLPPGFEMENPEATPVSLELAMPNQSTKTSIPNTKLSKAPLGQALKQLDVKELCHQCANGSSTVPGRGQLESMECGHFLHSACIKSNTVGCPFLCSSAIKNSEEIDASSQDGWLRIPLKKKPQGAVSSTEERQAVKQKKSKSQKKKEAKLRALAQRDQNDSENQSISLRSVSESGSAQNSTRSDPYPGSTKIEMIQRSSVWKQIDVPTTFERDSSTECPICYVSLKLAVRVELVCKHNFHSHCLQKWFGMQGKSCPICRKVAMTNNEFPTPMS